MNVMINETILKLPYYKTARIPRGSVYFSEINDGFVRIVCGFSHGKFAGLVVIAHPELGEIPVAYSELTDFVL